MLRSLTSGVSGVKAHQTLLDVVGDNISNVSTTGFKKSTVQFAELMSQTTTSAKAPTGEAGGTNPSQVGLGVSVGAVTVDFTQGNREYTGGKADMAIDGDGFFVVEDGDSYLYTRAGNFTMDGNGDIVQSGTGRRLQGYTMTEDPLNPGTMTTDTVLSDINIPVGQKLPASATTEVGFRCNLDSRVGTVLPMGLNANEMIASGTIGGTEYSSISFAEGTTVNDFLTITFTPADGSSDVTVDMALSGVNTTSGLPELADATVDLDGDGNPDTVHFDDATGQLQVTASTTGETWICEMGGAMNYQVVTVDDGSGTAKSCLVEFNDLTSGNREISVWGQSINAVAGTVGHGTQELEVGADGTFNIVAGGHNITVGGGAGTDLTIDPNPAGTGVLLMQGVAGLGTYDLQSASIHETSFEIYDSLGNSHTLNVSFEKVDNNQWRYRVSMPDETDVTLGGDQTGLINFTPDGKVEHSSLDSVLNINFGIQGAEDAAITLDFTGQSLGTDAIDAVTQYGSVYTTKEYYQDGYTMGILNDFAISSDGVICGIYDNGQTQELYTVPLAVFSNSNGLEKVGNGSYTATANSGVPQILKPLEGGAGKISGGSLEVSNVDLTEEFVSLIEAQRGFQASARVITTSDQILEELMALKR